MSGELCRTCFRHYSGCFEVLQLTINLGIGYHRYLASKGDHHVELRCLWVGSTRAVEEVTGKLEECVMTNIAQLHRRALEETRSVVAGIDRAQWADASPCDGWDVQALLNHLVSGNLWAAELGSGHTIEEVGDRLDGDVLGNDALAAYDASAKAAAATFEAPGALGAPCAVSYGPVPGSVYAGHRFIDVLIHGWDLATATGQDATLDPELVDAAYSLLQEQADMVRASGMFGDDILVPAGVEPQTQLLAFIGRKG